MGSLLQKGVHHYNYQEGLLDILGTPAALYCTYNKQAGRRWWNRAEEEAAFSPSARAWRSPAWSWAAAEYIVSTIRKTCLVHLELQRFYFNACSRGRTTPTPWELDEDNETKLNLHGQLPHARETIDLGHQPNQQVCARAMCRRRDLMA